MARKQQNSSWLVIAGLLFLAFIIFSSSQFTSFFGSSVDFGGSSYVSRGINKISPNIGEEVRITLLVDVGSNNDCSPEDADICNDYYVLEEVIPQDIDIVSLTRQDICSLTETSPQRIVCVVLQDATDTSITYTFNAPDVPSPLSFVGTYMFQGDTEVSAVKGTAIVTVQPPASCTPDWQCDSWSAWSNIEESCGTRTRVCQDNNHCDVNTGKPSETEQLTCEGGSVCVPNWECSDWSAYTDQANLCGTRTRQCTDKNACGVTTGNPGELAEKSCETGDEKIIVPPPPQVGGNIVLLIAAVIGYFIWQRGKKK